MPGISVLGSLPDSSARLADAQTIALVRASFANRMRKSSAARRRRDRQHRHANDGDAGGRRRGMSAVPSGIALEIRLRLI